VLVDLALPGASALSTELRAAGVHCAIVALSGDEPALEHGFDAVVRRPLDLAALLHYTSRVPVKVFAA
jgi:hypothetical protein